MSTLVVNEIEPATGTNLQINSNLDIPGNSLKVNTIQASSGSAVGFSNIHTNDITITGNLNTASIGASYPNTIQSDVTLSAGTHINVNEAVTIAAGATVIISTEAEVILVPASFFFTG